MGDLRLHHNLIDSSRQFFELDPGAAIEAEHGWLFGAGSATHPVISNAAFRREDSIDAEDFVGTCSRVLCGKRARLQHLGEDWRE